MCEANLENDNFKKPYIESGKFPIFSSVIGVDCGFDIFSGKLATIVCYFVRPTTIPQKRKSE